MDGVTFTEPEVPAPRKPTGWHRKATATWESRKRFMKQKSIGRKPRLMAEPVPVACPKCFAPMSLEESGYECKGRFCNVDAA
jgi:hypothetical protein